MREITVLSLFDGMGCGYITLKQLGVKFTYYRSEISKPCNKLAAVKMPDAINLGDVCKVSGYDLPKIDIILAGSPCQGFSFAGQQLNFDDPRSALFFEFVRIWKECKEVNPNVKFLLENVQMKNVCQVVINNYMGVWPVKINSALMTAQSRNRLYWSDIRTKSVGLFGDKFTDIPQPKDQGITLQSILDKEPHTAKIISKKSRIDLIKKRSLSLNTVAIDPVKACCLMASSGGNTGTYITVKQTFKVFGQSKIDQRKYNQLDGDKSVILLASNWQSQAGQFISYAPGEIRTLTLSEMCKLQGVPLEWFFDDEGNEVVSISQAAHMLGNGWTIPVIKHILKYFTCD